MLLRRLEGKVCVITASTDGIGFAIAKRLGLEGAKVIVSSRKEENVSLAVKLLRDQGIQNVVGVTCHVAKESDRKKLFATAIQHFGGIDVLVSNAAANPALSSVLDTPEPIWDKIFDVNVKASYLLAKEVKPFMTLRGGGSIVFISSIRGYQPVDSRGTYSVSKSALIALTKAAALECSRNNIRVNCVAPGVIETRFAAALYKSEAARKITLSAVPMQRVGKPDEIGGVVAFLVSEDSSYITGECIVAAGGAPSRL